MSDYHDYHENLAFPPQEIKSQHELSEQSRQSEVLIKALEKCEKLEKQLKIAVKGLNIYAEEKCIGVEARQALNQIKELDK